MRMIHNMPLRTSRGALGGRPLGSLDGVDDTMMGSIRLHCSFVSSILMILHIQHAMSRFFIVFSYSYRVADFVFDFK